MIGASTFESFIQRDKPTLDVLNEAGLDVSAAGNHEFDGGYADLVNRVMKPYDATANPEGGADWQYLAANVRKKSDNSYALPDVAASPGTSDGGTWMTTTAGGVDIGFIGAVTEDLPSLVSPSGIADIKISSIVAETNAAADKLKADGRRPRHPPGARGRGHHRRRRPPPTTPPSAGSSRASTPTSTRSCPATPTWPTTTTSADARWSRPASTVRTSTSWSSRSTRTPTATRPPTTPAHPDPRHQRLPRPIARQRREAGAAQFAAAVTQLESTNPNTIFAAAGDLIGASTFDSFIQKDKPTLDVLNAAGLDVSAAGNHEFDQGYTDLVNRVMAPFDATANPYGGAAWQYIAANMRKRSDNAYALPDITARTPDANDASDGGTWTTTVGGVKVGFIGGVTEELSSLVSPAGIADLKVNSIIDETNAAADRLKAGGADMVDPARARGRPDASPSPTRPRTTTRSAGSSTASTPTSAPSSPGTPTSPTTT